MHFILIKNIRIMKKFGLFFISAFMMVLEGLRDRYIGSLFRVDEPVPDDLDDSGFSVEINRTHL